MAEEKEETSTSTPGAWEPREDMVFEFMKELFAFGYTAAERMEERAEEFSRMRKERMEDFRRDREEVRGKFEERTSEARAKVRKDVQSVMREVGIATKDEVEEIKAMIADLSAKLEKAEKSSGRSSGSSKA